MAVTHPTPVIGNEKLRILLISTVVAGAFGIVSGANAADYGSGVATEGPESAYTHVEFGSGWYIRGDISWNIGGRHSQGSAFIPQFGNTLDTDYSDAIGFRAGFGNQINEHLRLETTLEHNLDSEFQNTVAATFSGRRDVTGLPDGAGGNTGTDTIFFDNSGNVTATTTGRYTSPTAPPINGSEQITASYSLNNFLVSAYYDMPQMGRFRPYVGLGAGVAQINYAERRVLNCQAQASEACTNPVGAQGVPVTNFVAMDVEDEFYEFAYQLSLGTAYELSDTLMLDVGYSYTQVGDGQDISYSDGTAIQNDGVSLHQVRLGLRYEIW